MSTMKEYAKQAKERMKSGFWQEAQQQLDKQKQVAATLGVDMTKASKTTHDRIARMVHNPCEYVEEEEFYNQVVEIINSKTLVTNPLMLLADQEYFATLSPHDKQAYLLKLSTKYQQAVARYNILTKNIKNK